MLPPLFIIKNVKIWNSSKCSTKDQSLQIVEGKIEEIQDSLENLSAYKNIPKDFIFDGNGHVLMPSGVDAQVHLRVPGQEQKEKPETGLMAALKGGVGALLTMPNTVPVLDNVGDLEKARTLVENAERISGVKVFFSAAMTIGQKGLQAVDALSIKKSGLARALTDDGRGVENDQVMESVFQEAEKTGLPLLQHAEYLGHGGSVSASDQQRKLGLKAIPDESEWKMVERDISLLKKYPSVRYHLLHASLKKSVEIVLEARQKFGLKATCEVSPHHLMFSAEDIKENETSFKMNPPLRSKDNQSFLIEAMCDGRIDFVATDHAPHEKESKGRDYNKSAFGTTGLETSLRVLLSFWQKGDLNAQRLVEVFSSKPAEFLGIADEFGSIHQGRPLRAILVDPSYKAKAFSEKELESLSKNCVFKDFALGGRIFAHFNASGIFRFYSTK